MFLKKYLHDLYCKLNIPTRTKILDIDILSNHINTYTVGRTSIWHIDFSGLPTYKSCRSLSFLS